MILRSASPAEVATMLDWAAEEGWNPGLEDAEAFARADQGGFFVAEKKSGLAAAISVVNHSPGFAFLGLYICKPKYRGRGIGIKLWSHALEHAGARTVGLDGVAEQQANYAKSGFEKTGATLRFEGPVPDVTCEGLRVLGPREAADLGQLDLLANGFLRPRFLSSWLFDTETRRTVVLDGPEGPVGFATARLCREGCKIGPLIAPNAETALALMSKVASALGQTRAILDVPGVQDAFCNRLVALGWQTTFETARMYRGAPPQPGHPEMLFGVATLELG
ncbi:GNAT family N-acetyltransferase [Celeribacter sp. PS-C1]|uniref:GNAT family N-acetyltransferase n=1 Tax=Celeribacter sp. PS-C1 TaxID=2820813 RepID=UPI0021040650|nr:GNAT family N-acetyltransferase [Celeribacter sp. PS-C1]